MMTEDEAGLILGKWIENGTVIVGVLTYGATRAVHGMRFRGVIATTPPVLTFMGGDGFLCRVNTAGATFTYAGEHAMFFMGVADLGIEHAISTLNLQLMDGGLLTLIEPQLAEDSPVATIE